MSARHRRPRGRPAIATSALVPAASRAQATVADAEMVLGAEAIEAFARAVGGRDQLAESLAIAGAGSDVEHITALLLDPRYARWPLPRLCATAGISVAQLFAAYRKAGLARAHIRATHTIAEKLPAVVTDVMDRALSDPTVERHKLALELGQLLEKKGGILVQQNNLAQTTMATGAGSLEALQQAVGDVLFGGRRRDGPEPMDVDPVPDSSEPDPDEEDDDGPPDPAGPPVVEAEPEPPAQ